MDRAALTARCCVLTGAPMAWPCGVAQQLVEISVHGLQARARLQRQHGASIVDALRAAGVRIWSASDAKRVAVSARRERGRRSNARVSEAAP